MYLTFLIICLSLYIVGAESDIVDGRYIDLLPEEEKQEFLDRIARRIWNEVKSKDSPVEDHVEINEEQLDAQSEYVQRLLREESESLRRKGIHDNEDKNILDHDNNKTFIDLTFRETKRTKRADDNYKVIPVKTVYEEKQATAVNANGESNRDKEDIQVRNLRKSGVHSNVTDEKPINVETTRAINLSAVSFESTELKSKETESLDLGIKGPDNTTIESVDSNTNETELTKNVNVTEVSVNKEANDTVVGVVNSANTTLNSGIENSTITASKLVTENSNQEEVTTSSVTTQNVSDENVSIVTNENNVNANNNETNNSPSTEVTEALTESSTTKAPSVTENNSKIHEYIATQTSTFATSLPSPIDLTEETKSKQIVSKKYVTAPSTVSKLIDNGEDFDIIKFNANFNISFSQISNGKLNTGSINVLKNPNGLGGYEVHEIPPGQPPFVPISNIKIQPVTPAPRYEESHYIPIYNYAAKNAYFHPHNRFHKNHEAGDETFSLLSIKQNDDELSATDSMDMDDYNMNEKSEDDYYQDSKSYLRNIEKKPNNSVDSKLEMDYFFSRIGAKSDESDHQIKISEKPSFKDDTLKSHLTAVRSSLRDFKNFKENNKLKDSVKYFSAVDDKYLNDRQDEYDTVEIHTDDDYRFDKPGQESTEKSETSVWSRYGYDYNNEYVDNDGKEDYGSDTYPRVKLIDLITKDDDNEYVKIENINKSDDPEVILNGKLEQLFDNNVNGNVEKKNAYLEESVLKAHNINRNDEINSHSKSKSNDVYMEAFLNVLSDMISMNSSALRQYDWLGSTVDIQSALHKLEFLIEKVQNGVKIHPSDWQLLKYIAYLYKSVMSLVEDSQSQRDGEEKQFEITDPLIIVLMPRRQLKREFQMVNSRKNYSDVDELLQDLVDFGAYLQDGLYGLHTAIKNISLKTKYNKQNWYQYLKESYFGTPTRKQLLEILLHLFTLNLLEIIEKSSTNAAEKNYVVYIKQNQREVARTKDELNIVIRLLEELRSL